jgi:hypothetical protein
MLRDLLPILPFLGQNEVSFAHVLILLIASKLQTNQTATSVF